MASVSSRRQLANGGREPVVALLALIEAGSPQHSERRSARVDNLPSGPQMTLLLAHYVFTAGFAAPSSPSPPSCDLPAILQPGVTNEQIALPADPKDLPAWRDGLAQWRASCRAAIGYTGKIYEQPALNWTSTSYIQPQSHPYDRLFYDVSSHSYTMDVFLADLTQRYGGIDSVLVWPTYTNIGMDDRNQFDLIRAMPGGAPPPAAAAAACCRRPRARARTPPPPPCG